ncbi:SpoIIE family protein phosphatase [Candidatus Margulisiibacteriota bacterium]
MSWLLLSSIIAFIANLLLGLFVFYKNPKSKLNIVFALFLLANASGVFGDFFSFTLLANILSPVFWLRIAYSGAVFTPPLFIHFIFLFSRIRINKYALYLLYALSGIALLFNWFSNDFFQKALISGQVLSTNTGLFYDLFMAYVGLALLFSLFYGIWKYFNSESVIKNRLRYHIYAVILLTLALVFYYPAVKLGIPLRIDNLCQVLYCTVIVYAITKKDVLDFNVIISRYSAMFISAVIVATSFLITYVSTYHNKWLHIISLLTLILLWSLFFSKFNKIVLTPLEKKFLRGYYDIQKIITSLSTDLLLVNNKLEVLRIISNRFKEELETKDNFFIIYDNYKCKYQLYKADVTTSMIDFSEEDTLIKYFSISSEPILFKDLPKTVQNTLSMYSLSKKCLFYPVKAVERLIGIFIFGEKLNGEKYTINDFGLIKAINNQLLAILERFKYQEQLKESNKALKELNESLNEKVQAQVSEIEEKRKLEQDLQLAKEIQFRVLPDRIPKITNYKFETIFQPAKIVSGDYYDFLVFSEESMFIVIADIVGKGFSASLLMIQLKNMIHQYIKPNDTPVNALTKLNRAISESAVFEKYVPLICAKLDTKNYSLTYSNAGHEPGYFFSGGSEKELSVGGCPLGMDINENYEQEELKLKDRDLALFFTDGLTDARNEKGESFGMERIINTVNEYQSGKDPQKRLVQYITDKWLAFSSGENRQKDDMSLVSIEVEKLKFVSSSLEEQDEN